MQIYLSSDDPALMQQVENALREKELSEFVQVCVAKWILRK